VGFGGTTTFTVEPSALVLIAAAADAQTLDQVKDVTGRHLERFGEKDGPVVTWQWRAVPRPVRPGSPTGTTSLASSSTPCGDSSKATPSRTRACGRTRTM
jgi:Uncharacterized protein conserved in bacteria (DUF2218)